MGIATAERRSCWPNDLVEVATTRSGELQGTACCVGLNSHVAMSLRPHASIAAPMYRSVSIFP
jgi:hypothetical protein